MTRLSARRPGAQASLEKARCPRQLPCRGTGAEPCVDGPRLRLENFSACDAAAEVRVVVPASASADSRLVGAAGSDNLQRVPLHVLESERTVGLGVRADFVRSKGCRIAAVGDVDVGGTRRKRIPNREQSTVCPPRCPFPLPFCAQACTRKARGQPEKSRSPGSCASPAR
jgi:hypothetical protein